jgi:hypothetical protein
MIMCFVNKKNDVSGLAEIMHADAGEEKGSKYDPSETATQFEIKKRGGKSAAPLQN